MSLLLESDWELRKEGYSCQVQLCHIHSAAGRSNFVLTYSSINIEQVHWSTWFYYRFLGVQLTEYCVFCCILTASTLMHVVPGYLCGNGNTCSTTAPLPWGSTCWCMEKTS